jgi:hypothetical protein
MPPLLAALLMMEFGCDFRIVAAIDLNMEWGKYSYPNFAKNWYNNSISETYHGFSIPNSYWWPAKFSQRSYKIKQ